MAQIFDLNSLGMMSITGEDAVTFLQGQLTNDVRLISKEKSQIAGYCTAKGRLLATLLLWQTPTGIALQLNPEIATSIQKRLSMYVLRAKVNIEDSTKKWARFGIAGDATSVLEKLIGGVPETPMDTISASDMTLIRLHGSTPRYELVVPISMHETIRSELTAQGQQSNIETWNWLEVQSGVGQVETQTQEEFVPQMLNFDLLNGISFNKGCYTGQEIVARTHYLGKVKRRTLLAHLDTDAKPHPGDKIYGVSGTEAAGMIVNAAANPETGYDVLVEVRLESLEAGTLALSDPQGPKLKLLEMPYAVS